MIKGKELVFKSEKMELVMKVIGKMVKLMDKEDLFIVMEKLLKAIG